jgi:gamma-polyglutamate biosynthesis protein CapA
MKDEGGRMKDKKALPNAICSLQFAIPFHPESFIIGVLSFLIIFNSSCRPAQSSNSRQPRAPHYAEERVTFLAVGDIMLSRGVAGAIAHAKDPLLPFRRLDNLLRSTDFNFGNLESPISGNDRVNGHDLVFNTHTGDTLGLRSYNFQVLNLANNHALDQRTAGLQYSRKYLQDHGITFLGVGENLVEAWEPKTISVNGIRIGFIGASYSSVNDGGATRNDYVARIEDTERLKNAIAGLRSQVDFIVVTMHAGIEYTRKPIKSQVDFAHAAIDLGADLVIGAHPHWIQTIEHYKGRYIFYSLGNFIFDQRQPGTTEGLVLRISLQKGAVEPPASTRTIAKPTGEVTTPAQDATLRTRLEQIELMPVIIERYSTPRMTNAAESKRILATIGVSDSFIRPE